MNRLNPSDLTRIAWYELKRILAGIRHTASIDITDACNLRCTYCYHFRDKDQFVKDIPLEIWKERFKGLYAGGIRFVTLLGGEPALRQDVLMAANSIFSFIDVITNGTIKIPNEFRHRLFISIDGSPETNDRIRGKNVFSRIIENYSGDDRAVFYATLNMMNYKELEDIVKQAQKYQIKAVTCGMYTPCGDASDPVKLSIDDRNIIAGEIKKVKNLYPGILRITERMLDWYKKGDHTLDYCYWREGALHFDVSMEEKKCFGHVLNCANCGCLAGAVRSPVMKLMHPVETIKSLC
jgi:MoaA/NifB/PqqE/SkfB family radical SAM enzyme